MTELSAALCLDTRAKKLKSKFKQIFLFPRVAIEPTSRVYSHTFTLLSAVAMLFPSFFLIFLFITIKYPYKYNLTIIRHYKKPRRFVSSTLIRLNYKFKYFITFIFYYDI